MKKFNEYKQLNLPQLSREILEQWEQEGLFEKSITTREGHPQFLFFEGPPSANGMPGIHHVMARTIKDTFCRFKTMQGFQVRRKAGWDTHGLPVELGVEKMLGITKEDIGKKISVDEYNAACRREVMKYTKEWTNLTKQMGYWVDLDNPYITYDNKYIETLWYLLKELYKKGYLYKGYTIQPYSPAAGTGLSSHELNQPGCYRDVKDLTCTARFKVKGKGLSAFDFERSGLSTYIIAWTTTPWTLPSNTALCVGPKIDYVEVETPAGDHIILAEARLSAYQKDLCGTDEEGKPVEPKIVARYKGADLVGLEYEPLFPWVNPLGTERTIRKWQTQPECRDSICKPRTTGRVLWSISPANTGVWKIWTKIGTNPMSTTNSTAVTQDVGSRTPTIRSSLSTASTTKPLRLKPRHSTSISVWR